MAERVHPSRETREYLRLRAWQLYQDGWRQCDIAQALGVCKGSVSVWVKKASQKGKDALKAAPIPPRQARLSIEQLGRLQQLLALGAEHAGFRGERWTQRRVAELIRAEFGIHYHPFSMYRILRRIGFSQQKPAKRASQRDEAAIAAWREKEWPAIKQTHNEKGEA